MLIVLLLGLGGFTYRMQEFMRNHTEYALDYYGMPAGIGEVLWATFWGILAMLAGLGLNVKKLIQLFMGSESRGKLEVM